MAIVKYPPNTIYLSGDKPGMVEVNDVAAGVSILPGMLLERYNSSGTPLYKPHSAAGKGSQTYALNQSMLNKGVSDAYAIGDLVEAGIGAPGSTWWARLASGQNVVNGAKLTSNGAGYLRAVAAGEIACAQAIESMDASAAAKMIRVEVIVDHVAG